MNIQPCLTPSFKRRIAFSFYSIIAFSILTIGCSGPLPDQVQSVAQTLPEYVDYNFHVKPILSDGCYTCHGPDPNSRKAGLRLDIEEEAFKKLPSGKFAIIKGDVNGSEIIRRMLSSDEDLIMPPLHSNLTVSDRDIALIAKWIDQGAEWKEHWSFLPLEEPKVPELSNEWKRINEIRH